MKFYVLKPGEPLSVAGLSKESWSNIVILKGINWNDYSFYTSFEVTIFDEYSNKSYIGKVRIGFRGQTHAQKIFDILPAQFSELGSEYFSLGTTHKYYESITDYESHMDLLRRINDIALNSNLIEKFSNEDVLNHSLFRDVSATTVREEYSRILQGLPLLTDFKFGFQCIGDRKESTYNLEFEVDKYSMPPSNVHAVIGKNGVGKTTLFNRMVDAALETGILGAGSFYDIENKSLFGEQYDQLKAGYFSRVMSVSFSAFDTFQHPEDNDHPAKGPCYSYLGLIDRSNNRLKNREEIYMEFIISLGVIFSDSSSLKVWRETVLNLIDTNNFTGLDFEVFVEGFEFAGGLSEYIDSDTDDFEKAFLEHVRPLLELLSSGHFIVLRIIVELLRRVETKTLVLIDEPETHLHPPLLSALIRTISTILHRRNGVAIIATHSPVVLQEVPKSCVWKIFRTGEAFDVSRPKIETYGENVGTLTEEVFSLDINKSGFIVELEKAVEQGGSFDEILNSFNRQLGTEGRFILKALIANRDEK